MPGLRERLTLHHPTHALLEQVIVRHINRRGERGREESGTARVYRTLVTGGSAAEFFTLDQATQ